MSIGITMGKKKTPFVQYILASGVGDILYTSLPDRTISSVSTTYGIGLSTRRLIAIHPKTKEITNLTEVTILSLTK